MTRLRTTTLIALLILGTTTTVALAADGAKGTFHFGNVQFEPVDAFAYQDTSSDPAKPLPIVLLANFKIDRAAALNAIDTPGALIEQSAKTDGAAFLVLRVVSKDRCGSTRFSIRRSARSISATVLPQKA